MDDSSASDYGADITTSSDEASLGLPPSASTESLRRSSVSTPFEIRVAEAGTLTEPMELVTLAPAVARFLASELVGSEKRLLDHLSSDCRALSSVSKKLSDVAAAWEKTASVLSMTDVRSTLAVPTEAHSSTRDVDEVAQNISALLLKVLQDTRHTKEDAPLHSEEPSKNGGPNLTGVIAELRDAINAWVSLTAALRDIGICKKDSAVTACSTGAAASAAPDDREESMRDPSRCGPLLEYRTRRCQELETQLSAARSKLAVVDAVCKKEGVRSVNELLDLLLSLRRAADAKPPHQHPRSERGNPTRYAVERQLARLEVEHKQMQETLAMAERNVVELTTENNRLTHRLTRLQGALRDAHLDQLRDQHREVRTPDRPSAEDVTPFSPDVAALSSALRRGQTVVELLPAIFGWRVHACAPPQCRGSVAELTMKRDAMELAIEVDDQGLVHILRASPACGSKALRLGPCADFPALIAALTLSQQQQQLNVLGEVDTTRPGKREAPHAVQEDLRRKPQPTAEPRSPILTSGSSASESEASEEDDPFASSALPPANAVLPAEPGQAEATLDEPFEPPEMHDGTTPQHPMSQQVHPNESTSAATPQQRDEGRTVTHLRDSPSSPPSDTDNDDNDNPFLSNAVESEGS